MLIKNIRINTVTKGIIDEGYIKIEDGKIVSIGENANAPLDTDFFDGTGFTAYPGFIDGHSHIGMFGDSLGFEADDGNEETDPSTPHLRAIDAINPLDYCFSEAVTGGVTCVVTGPGSANPIGGQMAAIKTSGVCVDKMVVKEYVAMKFALGENPKTVYNGKNQTPMTRMGTVAVIREQLKKAGRYMSDLLQSQDEEDFDVPEYDIKCEALLPLLNKKVVAQFHAHRADDIFTAIRIAKEFDFNYTIAHCTQGHLVVNELLKEGVSALAGPILCDRSKPELKHLTPELPAILSKNDVLTAIITDHPVIPVQYLPLCAGLAVREGMAHDEALKAITINPAIINKIDDRVGSIEIGKDADIVIFKDDPLNIMSKPVAVFVDGIKVYELNDRGVL